MIRPFAAALRQTRRAAGFHSAYSFYHDNGGRRVFPFSYAYYSRIERGLALPRPQWLAPLFSCLRIIVTPEDRRPLALAYLQNLVGDASVFSEVFEPYLKAAPPAPLHVRAVRQLIDNGRRPFSDREFAAVTATPLTFRCFLCLNTSRRPLAVELVADATRGSLRETVHALESLAELKLAERTPNGLWRTPLSKVQVNFPSGNIQMDKHLAPFRRCVGESVKEGRPLMGRYLFLRAHEADILTSCRGFRETMEAAQGCAVEESDGETGVYFIYVQVDELMRRR